MGQVSCSYSPPFPCHLLVCCILPCHHLHFICMFFKTCIRPFSPLSVSRSDTPVRARRPLRPCFVSGRKKCSRNGPRFSEWPRYITGRPPVKFRSIWRSFDAPTVNRVARSPFSLQPNTSSHSLPSPTVKLIAASLPVYSSDVSVSETAAGPHLFSLF